MQSLVCSLVDLEEQHNILHLAFEPSCYCAGLTKGTFLPSSFSILLEHAKKNATLAGGREHEKHAIAARGFAARISRSVFSHTDFRANRETVRSLDVFYWS